ncbi:DUF1003 domain-containing protein [Candidatus Woesearchaeota archaeon]|nr:DUF1003 domain-containing protein [Candidatus Woesearchaeota archaeon]MBW3016244.1 DUF1003 domain-containing protein [Candidatus Woesearchaeota archaeon]
MLKVGEPSPAARIYACTKCGNLKALLVGELAPLCENCAKKGKEQQWKPTSKEIIVRSRNIAAEIERKKNWLDRTADKAVELFSTPLLVILHVIWFAVWILMNTGKIPGGIFDPFPFGLLTMVVSLEAIFLAFFILISQNRAAEASELRAELDYQVDVAAEKRGQEILALVHELARKKK